MKTYNRLRSKMVTVVLMSKLGPQTILVHTHLNLSYEMYAKKDKNIPLALLNLPTENKALNETDTEQLDKYLMDHALLNY